MSKIEDLPVVYSYTGNGVTTVFPFGCMIFKLSDIVVYLNDEKQTTGFTVASNNYDAGGTVTFATAPANGVKITIQRVCDEERLTEYSESGVFRADPTNDEFNHIYALIQNLSDAITRCIKVAVTQDENPDDVFQHFQNKINELIHYSETVTAQAQIYANAASEAATEACNYAESVKFGLRREPIDVGDWQVAGGVYKIFFPDVGIISAAYRTTPTGAERVANVDIQDNDAGVTLVSKQPFTGYCLITDAQNSQLVYHQTNPSYQWFITHNLGKYPSVQCLNDDGVVMAGTIIHDSLNALHIEFTEDVSGIAVLN